MIRVSKDLTLPDDAATQVLALLGRRGCGKTYASRVIVEGMLRAGSQVVVLDPVGSWWGLRLDPSGKKPSAFDVPVFGGQHGDVTTEAEGGALVAQVIVERGISAVLDISSLRKAARIRFVTAFGEELFHRKKTARSPLHLVLEEAQVFAPQMGGRGGSEAPQLGAIEDLVRLGRNFGIGVTLISQRPQSVNKEVLTQVELLFAMQLNGSQERDAIKKWVTYQGVDVPIDALPELEVGQAFAWSPQWLRVLKRIKFGRISTFDSSATPTKQAQKAEPKPLDQAELEALAASMSDVVERKKADDPKVLRAEISKLRKAVAAAERTKSSADPAELAQARKACEAAERAIPALVAQYEERSRGIVQALEQASEAIGQALDLARTTLDVPEISAPPVAVPVTARPTPHSRATPPASRRSAPASGGVRDRILGALARLEAVGVTSPERRQAALFAGYKNTASKGFANTLSGLHVEGLVAYGKGTLSLTDAGRAAAPHVERAPTTEDLHRQVEALVQPVEWRILRVLIEAYPSAIGREDLGAAAGYSNLASKGFANSISRLSSLGFVEYPERGEVVAARMLFL